jgi:serine protease Do
VNRKLLPVILIFGLLLPGVAAARVSGLPDFTDLVEETAPAVVNIQVRQFGELAREDENQPSQEEIPEIFRRFFDVPGHPRGRGQPDRQGAGSGFIIESDGYIVTNHHVVDGADEIIVRMADRREFEAEVVGTDELSDIALLKVNAEDLPTLKLGDSDRLQRGEWVVAIGSPFNFDQTVTAGIVSAKGRRNNQQQYVPFIQTDVAINRGNSGGPLLNMDGEVVGINSWILSGGGGYIGLSFAIPIETASNTIRQLRESGRVERGLLGVRLAPMTREMAEAFGLDKPVGALVDSVNDGSAAEKAGIEAGDIILEFEGEPIETWGQLPPLVGANPPGTRVDMLVSRGGKEDTFTVVLDALDDGSIDSPGQADSASSYSNKLGLAVDRIEEDRRRSLGDPDGGVLVRRVESDQAYRAGIRPGDVILMVNNRKVEDVKSFDEIAGDLEPGKAVALRVMREGATRFLAYTPEADDD